MDTNHYLQRIQDAFPELKWTRYRRVQDGVDHVVILLDNEIVFRFEDTVDDGSLARERRVLSRLKTRLTIPVPDYTFLPDAQDFAGYVAIPGTRLSPWRFRRLSKRNRSYAAERLGDFLSALHSFSLMEARSLGVEEEESFSDARSWTEQLFDQHASELKSNTRDLCERWLTDLQHKRHAFSAVLAHNDLWHKHIYIDPGVSLLTGIIDWGDLSITDPAWDFYGFWAYGEDFVDAVLSRYEYTDSGLKERSRDCFRLKVVMSSCFPVERTRKYAKQLLSGIAEERKNHAGE